MAVKLSTWEQGMSYKTAWKWFKQGALAVAATQLPSGTTVVQVEEQVAGKGAISARVCSNDQKAERDRQGARLLEWATAQGLAVSQVIREIGGGLNGKRRGLMRLLGDRSVTTIIVEHRDRLARFGLEFIQSALQAQGRRVLVVDRGEMTDDIVRDLVVFSLCARLYGRRSAKRRAERAVKGAIEDARGSGT